RFHEVGEAEDLDDRESVVGGRRVLARGQVDHFITREVRAVGAEVGVDAIARHDDRVFLELPALRLLMPGEELQAGRVDDREVDFRLRRRRDRNLFRGPAARGEQDRYEGDSDCRSSIVTRTPAPVAPFASRGVSFSAYAVPAISR